MYPGFQSRFLYPISSTSINTAVQRCGHLVWPFSMSGKVFQFWSTELFTGGSLRVCLLNQHQTNSNTSLHKPGSPPAGSGHGQRPLTNSCKSCIFSAERSCQCTSIPSQTYAIAVSLWSLNRQKILKQCWLIKGFPCLLCKIRKNEHFLQINVLIKSY